MSDLPYAQPIFSDDPKNDDQNNNMDSVPTGSGSSFSEKPPVESSFSPETNPDSEKLRSPENIPVPKPEIKKIPEAEKEILPTPEKNDEVENVVDKTSEITTLHDIKPTKDKLTIEADEEEERFIEEVEKHHGNL